MPNVNRDQTMKVPTGDPDTWSVSAPSTTSAESANKLRFGELGKAYDYGDRTYQRVQLDSGATASTSVGIVAANQLAFWKDRSNYIVTNDKRFALYGGVANSFANNVAGIFRSAVTAGYYCDVLIRGRNIAVAATANCTGGTRLFADLTASTANVDAVGVGVTLLYNQLGVVRTAVATSVAYADIDIPNIP